MEQIYLKDICDLDNGYAFKSDDYVDISNTLNCRMSNIRPDGSFDIMYNAKYLPDEYSEKYKDYLLKDGDLIIAMTDMAGDPKILGVPTVVDTKGYNLLLNQRVGKLRFIKDGVDADYLKLALQSKNVRSYLKRFAGGGVQLNVSKKDILNSPVKMRTEEEQAYIVNVFRKLKSIINQRRSELEMLDNLIKARFVELFGILENPVQNFRRTTLKELCSKITDGKHGGCTQEEGTKRYFVGAREIYDDEVHYDTAPEINVDEFEKDYKRCNIEIGDFLIVNTGATIGKSAIATDARTVHTLLQKSVALLKVKQELLNPVFLKWCYRVNTTMYMVESASAQPNLLLSKINATEIYVPDIGMQEQFADFVVQVDKSEFICE